MRPMILKDRSACISPQMGRQESYQPQQVWEYVPLKGSANKCRRCGRIRCGSFCNCRKQNIFSYRSVDLFNGCGCCRKEVGDLICHECNMIPMEIAAAFDGYELAPFGIKGLQFMLLFPVC